MSFRFVSKQGKTSNVVGLSSLVFWLIARELWLKICLNTFQNFNRSLNERRLSPCTDNSEVKHDVYGKRQTAKIKLLLSLFSCVYSRVKLSVFAMNSRRRYSTFVGFIYGLDEKNSKSEVLFAVCRLPLTSCLTSLITTEWAAEKCLDKLVQRKQGA